MQPTKQPTDEPEMTDAETVTLHHVPGNIALRDQVGHCVAVLFGPTEMRDDWGERIALRWNSHVELLKALQGVLRVADRKTVEFDAARAAINKALGKE